MASRSETRRKENARRAANSTVVPRGDDDVSTVTDDDDNSSSNATTSTNTPSSNQQTAQEKVEKKKREQPIKIYRYPSSLDTVEQPHSVEFRVKIRENTAAGKALAKNYKVNYDDNSNNRIGNQDGFIEGAYAVGGGLAGAAAGNIVARAATSGGNVTGVAKTFGTIGGGLLGASGGAKIADARQGSKVVKTNTFINLHIPTSPQVNYGAQWQDTDIGALGGLIAKSGGDLGSLLDTALTGEAGEFMMRTLAGMSDLPRAIGADINITGALQAATGQVPNPNKEQLFKSMNFRSFNFDYKFAPRNQQEFEQVEKIIMEFKKNMHSERSEQGLFLIYPSEFDIVFKYKGKRNQFLHQIKSCALVDMRIQYGSGGTFTTFTQGRPSEITVGLVFKELEILNKDDVEGGF